MCRRIQLRLITHIQSGKTGPWNHMSKRRSNKQFMSPIKHKDNSRHDGTCSLAIAKLVYFGVIRLFPAGKISRRSLRHRDMISKRSQRSQRSSFIVHAFMIASSNVLVSHLTSHTQYSIGSAACAGDKTLLQCLSIIAQGPAARARASSKELFTQKSNRQNVVEALLHFAG